MTSILKVNTLQDSTGTTAMTIDSSGRVLQPAKPCFFAHFSSGTFEITSSNSTKTPLDATDVNIGNCWSTTNYEFTAPVAGEHSTCFPFLPQDALEISSIFPSPKSLAYPSGL